jgi:hypothetical protein
MTPLVLLLAALPGPGVYGYTLELDGLPAAVVDLEIGKSTLTYRRTFYFSRGNKTDAAKFSLPEKERLASFALLTPLPKGCVDARDESSNKRGQLCVTDSSADEVTGTLFGEAFTASYAAGLLTTLQLPQAKYVRGHLQASAQPFNRGFEAAGDGKTLVLVPAVKGTHQRPVVTMKDVKADGNCLDRAEAVVRANPGKYEVLVGLVSDGKLFWPHAWLIDVDTRVAYDPTLPEAEKRDYLEIPRHAAGDAYLQLLSGNMRMMRLGETQTQMFDKLQKDREKP